MSRGAMGDMLTMNSLGDGSTLSLDFTTGVLDSRLTFSRASTATFVNSSGYVEYAGANLLLQGSNLGNATSWFGNGLTSRNPSADPNGLNEAVELNEDATNTVHAVIQVTSQNFNGLVYTSTVYMKAGTNRTIGFMRDNNVSSDATVFYTLTGSGTTTIANGTYGIVPSINAVGGGWYRCVFTIKGVSTANVTIGTAKGTAYGDWSFAGTVGNSIHVWGAQLNPGSTAQTYYSTTTAAYHAPRFDYSPTTIGEPRGLLIEGQATSLTKYSETFTNAYWETTASNVTAADSVATSPTGVALTASTLTEIAGTVSRHIHELTGAFTPVAANAYTMSCFVKQPTSNAIRYVQLAFWSAGFGLTAYMNYDLQAGTVGTGGAGITAPSITQYPNGWYRITATATSVAVPGASGFQLGFSTTSGAVRTESYTASAPLKSIQLFGAQVEVGSGATSYISTGASQVTRNADICEMTGTNFSSWFTQPQGTIFLDCLYTTASSSQSGIQLADNTGVFETNRTSLRKSIVIATRAATTTRQYAPSATAQAKSAFAFGTADYKLAQNGSTFSPVAGDNGAPPVNIDRLLLYTPGGTYLNGTIRQIKFWPTSLPQAQLNTLTTL
jgi:hypothetical protein